GRRAIHAGTYAGNPLSTSCDGMVIRRIDINPATGLPFGTVDAPTEAAVASGFTQQPIGIEMHPITNDDLFVTTWDDTTDGNNQILQIRGFAAIFTPSTTSTSSTSSTSTSSSTSSSTSTTSSTSTSSSSSSTSSSSSSTSSSTSSSS